MHFNDFLWYRKGIMNSKNVQTSECNELLLLFNSSSSFCLSSISVKMVLLAYLKEIQCAHHQLQFIKDRLEILHKSNPIAMEILLSKFLWSKWVWHLLRWTTSGAFVELGVIHKIDLGRLNSMWPTSVYCFSIRPEMSPEKFTIK